jgi:hypothetical protein
LSLEALAKAQGPDAKGAAERSAEEQRRALQRERDKVEKLAAELAQARSSLEALTKAATQTADAKGAAERRAEEQRRALQQERDRAQKLAAELAAARSSLEALTKARAADDVARDEQLATLRRELQKARADAAVALELLEAEYTRTEQTKRQLATVQAAARDHGKATAAPPVEGAQPKAPPGDAAQPAKPVSRSSDARVEQGDLSVVRLIARANLLLDQGNIGAARNMLEQAAAMGSAEALFWLAQTYDPLLLAARKTFGTQGDVARARDLYGRALAGGVSEARSRLEALQSTGGGQ